MNSIFNYDNKFFRGVNKIIDCFYISILWLIFSIPIFTIGASTTALYETVHKVIRRSKGYVWRTFWDSFKSNFKKSTKMWLIMLVIFVVLLADCLICKEFLKQNSSLGSMYYFFCVMIILEYIWAIYTFSYNARFELGMKGIMKNGALLAIAHLPWSALIVLVLAIAVFGSMLTPIVFLIAPAGVFMIYELILEKIFRKLMTPEELKRELEEDMEDKEA